MTSLKRYEKHGRLNDTWRPLSPATQAHCLTCEHDAEGLFSLKEKPFWLKHKFVRLECSQASFLQVARSFEMTDRMTDREIRVSDTHDKTTIFRDFSAFWLDDQ